MNEYDDYNESYFWPNVIKFCIALAIIVGVIIMLAKDSLKEQRERDKQTIKAISPE